MTRKYLSISIVAVLATSLTACGGSEGEKNVTNPGVNNSPKAPIAPSYDFSFSEEWREISGLIKNIETLALNDLDSNTFFTRLIEKINTLWIVTFKPPTSHQDHQNTVNFIFDIIHSKSIKKEDKLPFVSGLMSFLKTELECAKSIWQDIEETLENTEEIMENIDIMSDLAKKLAYVNKERDVMQEQFDVMQEQLKNAYEEHIKVKKEKDHYSPEETQALNAWFDKYLKIEEKMQAMKIKLSKLSEESIRISNELCAQCKS